mmetsp:Transcript_6870/g.17846  ORF Transcript_6870/g.17846 Transcript_6870/m.17846 type:complete len:96 (-) Transcript_6870:369-656(-)
MSSGVTRRWSERELCAMSRALSTLMGQEPVWGNALHLDFDKCYRIHKVMSTGDEKTTSRCLANLLSVLSSCTAAISRKHRKEVVRDCTALPLAPL